MSLSKQTSDTFHNGSLVDSSSSSTAMPGAGILDGAKDYLSKNPTALAMLLGGAGSGLAGGYLSSRLPQAAGEDKAGRRKRILRNALLAAGVGAGATGLAMTGAKQLNTALPEDDVDPATRFATGAIPRSLAVGAVGAGLMKKNMGNEDNPRRFALQEMEAAVKGKDPALSKKLGESINLSGDKGTHARSYIYEDLLNKIEGGKMKGINTGGFLSNIEDAGGILRKPGESMLDHGMSHAKRFGNRLFGRGSTASAVGAGGALAGAALAPELIQGLWNSVTGGSNT